MSELALFGLEAERLPAAVERAVETGQNPAELRAFRTKYTAFVGSLSSRSIDSKREGGAE